MSLQSELRVQTNIIRWLRNSFPKAFIWKTRDQVKRGVPDVLIITEDRTVFFEVKTKDGKAEKIQKATSKKINRTIAESYIVETLDEVKKIMKGKSHDRTNRKATA